MVFLFLHAMGHWLTFLDLSQGFGPFHQYRFFFGEEKRVALMVSDVSESMLLKHLTGMLGGQLHWDGATVANQS